ncbi:MAG: hypothetical protein OIF34_00130 [Porticoccaceae bacterium]|nr:hypothetical protein [Porticoccaceae bacterium]
MMSLFNLGEIRQCRWNMRLKVRHFAANTVNTSPTVHWETFITEVFLCFFCGVFAYMGYTAEVALLFYLNFAAALICFWSVLVTLIEIIWWKICSAALKRKSKKNHE